jgi:Tfp pilus assembly protein PilV
MITQFSHKGYSLVEVMVAITILMLSILGPITIAVKSYQSAQYARQQTTAFFLAQEGITAVNTIRNNSAATGYTDASFDPWAWTSDPLISACFTASGCGMDFRDESIMSNVVRCSDQEACRLLFNQSAPRAVYQHVSGEASPYRRVIRMQFANPEEILVESAVAWDSKLLGGSQEVRLSTSLFHLYKQ